MFGTFPGGPDWIDKHQRALECLDAWWEDMVQAGRDYKTWLRGWNLAHLPEVVQNTPGTLHDYFEWVFCNYVSKPPYVLTIYVWPLESLQSPPASCWQYLHPLLERFFHSLQPVPSALVLGGYEYPLLERFLPSFIFFVASAISNGAGVLSLSLNIISIVIYFDLFWLLPTQCSLGHRPGCW